MEKVVINTPLGSLLICGNSDGITEVTFRDELPISTQTPLVLEDAVQQITAYFQGKRTQFELKIHPKGTSFQKKVWDFLQQIPYGKTKSYQEMANLLGDPKVIRAAAAANGKNPIAIIIPCHRVVGSDGSLTGYAGGLHRKKWLLEFESPVKQGELF